MGSQQFKEDPKKSHSSVIGIQLHFLTLLPDERRETLNNKHMFSLKKLDII